MEMGAGFQGPVGTENRPCHSRTVMQFYKLTPAPWAAFSIRDCGIGARHDGAGHFLADGNGVLQGKRETWVMGHIGSRSSNTVTL